MRHDPRVFAAECAFVLVLFIGARLIGALQ